MPPIFYRCKCLRILFFICKVDILYLFTSAVLAAGRDSTNIRIQVIQRAPLRASGNVFTQDRVNLDNQQLTTKKTVSLGLVKLQSKTKQPCRINFSSKNNFKLTQSETRKNLGRYQVLLSGQKIDNNHPLNTDCNSLSSQLQIQPVASNSNAAMQSKYEDTLSMVITIP